nr:hypothetical protein [Tanacetum cinerariifolium]
MVKWWKHDNGTLGLFYLPRRAQVTMDELNRDSGEKGTKLVVGPQAGFVIVVGYGHWCLVEVAAEILVAIEYEPRWEIVVGVVVGQELVGSVECWRSSFQTSHFVEKYVGKRNVFGSYFRRTDGGGLKMMKALTMMIYTSGSRFIELSHRRVRKLEDGFFPTGYSKEAGYFFIYVVAYHLPTTLCDGVHVQEVAYRILGGVSSHEIEEHLPTTLCDEVHVQEVAYRHRDSVPKVLKDDEKEHEEDGDKHKDIEETTKQTKAA